MARSRINSRSKDLQNDDGAVVVSLIHGEQIQMDFTLNWLTNLSGYTLTAKIVEADMTGATDENGFPKTAGADVYTLPIIDADATDNVFKIVIPEDLIDNWVTQPQPEQPSYGWLGLEIMDNGVGNQQQIWKPLRGMVEVLYSPSEA